MPTNNLVELISNLTSSETAFVTLFQVLLQLLRVYSNILEHVNAL